MSEHVIRQSMAELKSILEDLLTAVQETKAEIEALNTNVGLNTAEITDVAAAIREQLAP